MSALPPETLPTVKDEQWRYADFSAIEHFAPERFATWREITVPAGEKAREVLVIDAAEPLLERLRVDVGDGGRFELFAVNSASDYARVDLEVQLGAGAHFEFGGVTIGGGEVTREFVTRTDHSAPDATSNQIVRAVHWGRATGNFLGAINVGRLGQRTDAAQDFKAMLLEKGASANAKPELEIFADDVKCAHGAAIGRMDEAARYYMASRGIPPERANALLIRAFIADAFAALEGEPEQEQLFGAALTALGDHA